MLEDDIHRHLSPVVGVIDETAAHDLLVGVTVEIVLVPLAVLGRRRERKALSLPERGLRRSPSSSRWTANST